MKLCLFCKYLWIDSGPGYSEYTPSTHSFECRKNHWDLGNNLDKPAVRRTLKMAEECPDYTPEEV